MISGLIKISAAYGGVADLALNRAIRQNIAIDMKYRILVVYCVYDRKKSEIKNYYRL